MLHLKTAHSHSFEDIDDRVDQCRQGKHSDPDFWCGFCVKRIAVDRSDVIGNAWSQRFDHVDAHFCGRGAFAQQSIEEWKHENQTLVCSQPVADGTGHPSGAAMSQTAPNVLASQKRLAEPMESEPSRRKRKRNKWVEMWQCVSPPLLRQGATNSTFSNIYSANATCS